ncbi:hypothetical protein Bcep1808_4975 [Burkholderia vietnamiensis G4]|uniref:Uncharacterized protein n=1 Tax=Burkholderia vietnamiensis (strain G4 / LMG 22486) TaxID=269482 RepID=A4JNS8_BURVG|nr:hypothetical protein Bcep1808_4975 [Burkholderia vietnamiensis G4]
MHDRALNPICKKHGISGARDTCCRCVARARTKWLVKRSAQRKEAEMKPARATAALIAVLALLLTTGCTSADGGAAQGSGMSRYGGAGGTGGGGSY